MSVDYITSLVEMVVGAMEITALRTSYRQVARVAGGSVQHNLGITAWERANLGYLLFQTLAAAVVAVGLIQAQ